MNKRNWFWGLFLVLAAVLIIVGQVTSFATFSFWTILAAVALGSACIGSLIRLNFWPALMSGSLLYIVLQKPLHLFYISPWQLLLAATLLGSGLSMIFRRRPRYNHHQYCPVPENGYGDGTVQHCSYGATEENNDDNHPYGKVSFSSASRYLHANALENGQFYASFGALSVYLDQVRLAPQGAEIFCDASFGTIILYVPRNWPVVDNVNISFGGCDNDLRAARPDPNLPALTVSGNAQFGKVEIQYI